MVRLRDLSYLEVTERLSKLGFRFYRQGKGSHELWVRDADGRVLPVPRYKGKKIRKGTVRAIIRETGLRPVPKSWEEYFRHGKRFTEDFPDRIEDLPPEERHSL